MPDYSSYLAERPFVDCILPSSDEALGDMCAAHGTAVFTGVWPSANLAIFYPFRLNRRFPVKLFKWLNGSAVSGNIDLGVYDFAGNRKISLGSTAQLGASVIQSGTVSTTWLEPGWYYSGTVFDNTTATIANFKPPALWARAALMKQMAAAFPLPATATFANIANAYLPWGGPSSQAVA